MKKISRRNVFRILDRDCVNPATTDLIKEYIDRILKQVLNSNVK